MTLAAPRSRHATGGARRDPDMTLAAPAAIPTGPEMPLAAQRKLVPPRSRYAAHMGRQARPGVRPPPGTVGKVSLTLSQQCVVAAHTWAARRMRSSSNVWGGQTRSADGVMVMRHPRRLGGGGHDGRRDIVRADGGTYRPSGNGQGSGNFGRK